MLALTLTHILLSQFLHIIEQSDAKNVQYTLINILAIKFLLTEHLIYK